MVKRLFSFLGQEMSGLHEAAYLLALFAILSQVAGFIRDRLLAHLYGAGQELDVYYAAFRIPDFIFVSVASLVSASVLVPFIISRQHGDQAEAKKFIDSIFSFFFFFIVIVCVFLFILMPFIAHVIFPGITDPHLAGKLVSYARILLISPVLLGLSNFYSSIAQAKHRFFSYAISPVLYNIVVYGVILGAVLHVLVQIPALAREKIFPRFHFKFSLAPVREVVLLSFPRTLALSSSHLSMIFLVAYASLMTEGSISVFNFAFNLQSVPLSIIGVSYSVAAFPTLSRLFGNGERDKFLSEILTAARHIIFWSVPITVLFVVLRAQVVRTVLGSGNFSWADTRLTAAALALFAISVLGQSLILLFVRGYYAASNTKKPLYINMFSSVFIIVFAMLFLKLFYANELFQRFIEALLRVQNISGTAVLMLPFAFTIGILLNVSLLWIVFERDFGKMGHVIFKTLFQTLGASLIMGYVSYEMLRVFDNVFDLSTLPGIFLQGLCAGLVGIFVGIVILVLLKNEETRVIWKTLHSKIWKAETIVPPQENL